MPKQLTVLIENRPGALAELARALSAAKVNITSIMLEGSLEFGVARIHVDNVKKGVDALKDEGFQVQVGDVLAVPLANEPGKLAELCETLEEAGVNIDSIFGTTARSDVPTVVLKLDDTAKAEAALQEFGEG